MLLSVTLLVLVENAVPKLVRTVRGDTFTVSDDAVLNVV